MAYFSKDVYFNKMLYASKVSASNVSKLIEAGMKEHDAELLAHLSHLRHKMHCSHDDEAISLLEELGTQYSDGSLICDVNELAGKYGLPSIPLCDAPEIDSSWDNWLIAEYFDVDEDEVEDDYDDYVERIDKLWENAKNTTSKNIRDFFKAVNEAYETDFPD